MWMETQIPSQDFCSLLSGRWWWQMPPGVKLIYKLSAWRIPQKPLAPWTPLRGEISLEESDFPRLCATFHDFCTTFHEFPRLCATLFWDYIVFPVSTRICGICNRCQVIFHVFARVRIQERHVFAPNEFPEECGKYVENNPQSPVFARVRVQAPHKFAQKLFPKNFSMRVLVLCRGDFPIPHSNLTLPPQQGTGCPHRCPGQRMFAR